MTHDDASAAHSGPGEDRGVLAPRPAAGPPPSGAEESNAGEFLLYSDLPGPELLTRLSDGDVLRMQERVTQRAREQPF